MVCRSNRIEEKSMMALNRAGRGRWTEHLEQIDALHHYLGISIVAIVSSMEIRCCTKNRVTEQLNHSSFC